MCGKLGGPLPRARLYLGWFLFKQREDGQICKHAGLPMGTVSDYGSKRGMEKQFYLQAVWHGEGALLMGSMEGITVLRVRISKN